jgi:hypothetical protein
VLVCKRVNLLSIRVFILKSINTFCKEKILRLDNTIGAKFIQLV